MASSTDEDLSGGVPDHGGSGGIVLSGFLGRGISGCNPMVLDLSIRVPTVL